MAFPQFVAYIRNFSLTASTTQTLVQYTAGTGKDAEVAEWGVSFNGSTAVTGVEVDLLRQTSAGSGGTTFTLLPWNEVASDTAIGSALTTPTSEPTAGSIISPQVVTPFGGNLVIQYAEGEGPKVKAGNRIGVRAITASGVSPQATAYIRVRE